MKAISRQQQRGGRQTPDGAKGIDALQSSGFGDGAQIRRAFGDSDVTCGSGI
jgi:hypothetical protein